MAAAKTRAEMIDKVLQLLGVLAAGQSASAEDAEIVGDTLDSVHAQINYLGRANFATSAFPDWAQEPFAQIIAEEVGPYFGKNMMGFRRKGEMELRRQMKGKRHGRAIEFDGY